MPISLSKDDVGKYRQRIRIDTHTLYADARIDSDADSAPDPHDLYDSALAACKAITLMMYAEKAGIPLERIDVEIVRDNSQIRDGMYRLNAELSLKGALKSSDKTRLEKVAEKCPIHKLMTETTTQVVSSYRWDD